MVLFQENDVACFIVREMAARMLESRAIRKGTEMLMRGVAELEWVLDHELLLAERYRRFVSVAMIKSHAPIPQSQLLGNTIRDSDVYFKFSDTFGAVLMSETDCSGALKAIDRYKENCHENVDMRFSIASYPKDHQSAPKFLSAAYHRMETAEKAEPGSVVTSD